MEPPATSEPSSSSHSRKERKTDDFDSDLCAFFAVEDNRRGVEIEWELPTSRRGIRRFINNPEAYVCTQLKKRQVEVREKQLTPDEAIQFHKAKETEVRNFVASGCFELAKDVIPDEQRIVGMRWLLTWKYGESYEGGKKAKARGIILGYQDPEYEKRKTSAPTPSRSGRQLFWQLCSWKRFRLRKGDISGAFLQGDNMTEELWCRPVKEITDALGLPENTPMLMRKAAYGLVQAPLQWFYTINNFLISLGYKQLQSEPCCWVWVDEHGQVRSIIHSHVDDLMFGGKEGDSTHQQLLEQLQQRFKWGSWETGSFIQCGIEVVQNDDYSIDLKQSNFINDIEEIHLTRDRSRQTGMPVTESEKTKLRGALGSLAWVCGQTCFPYAVDTNFLVTTIPVATVDDILHTNKIIREVKKLKDMAYRIHNFPENEELELFCWADAAWANRPNGTDSTEGIFVGMSTAKLRNGFEENVTPIHWRSGKIERTCRSPACAEVMGCLDGEDELTYLRLLWTEMQGYVINTRRIDESIQYTQGMLITDARNLFDKLIRPTATVKGAEKRSSIEALSLRENLERGTAEIHWVNSGAMIANSLTKPKEKGQFMLYLSSGFRWKIVYDEEFTSERRRKKAGCDAFENLRAQTHTQEKGKIWDPNMSVPGRWRTPSSKFNLNYLEMGTNVNFIQVSFHVTLGSIRP